jgi:RHS repeat-associated protein
MRGPDDAVVWLHGDHLGSTSLATSATGEALSRQLYYPFGEQRWASAGLPTDFQFTGQRIQSTIALYDYHARFYDPYVGRFIQPDTIVPSPGNPQHFNRYSYVRNNPLNFTDPSGHKDCGPACEGDDYIPELDEYYRFTTSDYDMLGIPLQDPWSDPNYSEWFSGHHSGCFMCHAARTFGHSPLTNDELAYYEEELAYRGRVGALAMGIGVSGAVVIYYGGAAVGPVLQRLLCGDGDCFNEIEHVYDSSLPAGSGYTDKLGRIFISPHGSRTDQLQVLLHESVHSLLTPRGTLQGIRANLNQWAYNNSHLLRYIEEALAEGAAQLLTNGSLIEGLSFPVTNGYVNPAFVVIEGSGIVVFIKLASDGLAEALK